MGNRAFRNIKNPDGEGGSGRCVHGIEFNRRTGGRTLINTEEFGLGPICTLLKISAAKLGREDKNPRKWNPPQSHMTL